MLARTEQCCPRCGRPVSARLTAATGSRPKIAEIIAVAADLCGFTPEQVREAGGTAERVYARLLVAHVACRRFGHTPAAVGRACQRDRKTIVHALGRGDHLVEADAAARADVDAILMTLGGAQ